MKDFDLTKFNFAEDDLDWLELNGIPAKVNNPFDVDYRHENSEEGITKLFLNQEYLHFATRYLLNMEMFPFQLVILDFLWRKRLPLLIGSRGSTKSSTIAVYCLLKMILDPGIKIVIVGNGLRQAKQVFDYMAAIWTNSAILRDIAGDKKNAGPRREVDRYEYQIGSSICSAIPIGDGMGIRGLRANIVVADEKASVKEEIFNVVVQGFAVVQKDPVQKVKEAARINKMKKDGIWNEQLEFLKKNEAKGNQIISSGTAYYSFNHFYRTYKKWHDIIYTRGDPEKIKELFGNDPTALNGFDWTDYGIMRIPYTAVPEGLLEPAIVAQAKNTLSRSQFLMEFASVFPTDSDGFFKRSVIESATTNKPVILASGKVQFSAEKTGNPQLRYIMGVDPAADQDNAAIVIVELHDDHRRVVQCWTTNRKKYSKLKEYYTKGGTTFEEDYYHYVAKKIRSYMRDFNINSIIMDKHGGGVAIQEALSSQSTCRENEKPVYPVIIDGTPTYEDGKDGIHILTMLVPNSEVNSDANHGMKKDLEDKTLLFPLFDTIEVAKSVELDYISKSEVDTYEDLLNEIEELKNEIASIVVIPSSVLGRETFDTPNVKVQGMKRGYLRKDRYSALLYANYYARNMDKTIVEDIKYTAMGGNREMITKIVVEPDKVGQMYKVLNPASKLRQHNWTVPQGWVIKNR